MISVCIATFNSEKYINQQLESILKQLNDTDEIIISDDDSTDNTEEIIKSYNDKRIKFIKNRESKGYTSNFENALKHSSGEIIFLSDHDDIWHNNKVAVVMSKLQDFDFFVSDCSVIDENGNDIANSYFQIRKPRKTFLGNILKFGYLGCCFAFRRKILQKALPFPPRRELCTHDNWLLVNAFAFYKPFISDEKLIKYRRHGSNTSTGGFTSKTTNLFKIKYRFYLLFHLLLRAFK
jgi:glycosyltransferase involved in cell wall biosynthesis